MKRVLTALVFAAAAVASSPSRAADVGVSISVGQPGFYGQINIGGYPQPQLLYPQPIMVQPAPVGLPPIYLYVPPEHARHWGRYCQQYHACGKRVFFVRDDWYHRVYVPHYQQYHGHDDHHHDHGRDDWHGEHGHDHHDHQDERDDARYPR